MCCSEGQADYKLDEQTQTKPKSTNSNHIYMHDMSLLPILLLLSLY